MILKRVLVLLIVFVLFSGAGCQRAKTIVLKHKPPKERTKSAKRKREAWEDFVVYFARRDPKQIAPAQAYPLYRMKPDGSEVSIAKFGEELVYSARGASFSGDGKRLAWTELSGRNQIAVMNSDGSGKIVIKEGVESYQPVLSHEGVTVAFVAVQEFGTQLMKENIAVAHLGQTVSVVPTQNPYRGSSATSPFYDLFDKRIYFEAQVHESRDLFSFNTLSGAELIRLTADGYNNSQPRVTPDGKKVIFVSNRDGKLDIYAIANRGLPIAEGTDQIEEQEGQDRENELFKNQRVFRLTQEGENKDPAISPDGKVVAFSSNRDGNWEIYLMRIDGTGRKRLTFNSGDDLAPSWSPL